MSKIISELGINHNGSIKICKKLIEKSFKAGCWGIKFQYRNLKRNFIYNNNNPEIGLEIINKEIARNYLNPTKIKQLSDYASKLGLKVGVSFFRVEDINDFGKYNFDFYKVPSAESLDFSLIKALIKKKKFLIISLGGLTEKNIFFKKKYFKIIKKEQNLFYALCIKLSIKSYKFKYWIH